MRASFMGNGWILAALIAAASSAAGQAAADQVIKPELFSNAGLVNTPEVVACTLSNGASAECVQFVVKYLPEGMETGPFCPETVDQTGGLWLWDGDQPGFYVLNRAFWEMMAALGFDFVNADGTVNVTDPAAGRPPDPSASYCLEATPDSSVEATIQIPLVPQNLAAPTEHGTVTLAGLALDGIPIFADAPSVQDTGHLPALDPCGGHFDPGGYYHWHEVATDMDTLLGIHGITDVRCGLPQSSSALFAYGYDGYPIYGTTDAGGVIPTDLDACHGHVAATPEYPGGVYHYHADTESHNLPPCVVGAVSEAAFRTNAATGLGSGGGPGGGRRPGGGGPPPQ